MQRDTAILTVRMQLLTWSIANLIKGLGWSDFTYVKVDYVCSIMDLHNREIIGFAAGKNKTAYLMKKAFNTIKANLSHTSIFHTDRGGEFKNETIDNKLPTFEIDRSLSKKACPYDNAVAEATFKTMKT